MKRFLLLVACVAVVIVSGKAQCPDFTDLTAPGVTCYYGLFANPFQYTGVMEGHHEVITTQGTDPYTYHQLPLLPPDESAVVKLGSYAAGGQAEAIEYQFTVDPDNSVLLVKFAVVLQDPNHSPSEQPRFVMRILNADGQLVDECAEYDVRASADIPGFVSAGEIRWRPWTDVGFDLTEFAGQTVTVQFVTYDCAFEAHFGYAYFVASCVSNQLIVSDCDGQSITFIAPSGYASYDWNNGDTTSVSTFSIGDSMTTASCLLTSAIGCQFTLSGTVMAGGLPTEDATFYDTICEGDSYHDHLFNLPPQTNVGTIRVTNTFYNASDCSGNDVIYTLYLTVVQKYTEYFDFACQGEDYDRYGFSYTNLQPGSFTDTIFSVGNAGCDTLFTILHLTVSTLEWVPTVVQGATTTCDYEETSYLVTSGNLSFFQWQLPSGVCLINGDETPNVSLYFTETAPNPAVISLVADNGCHLDTVSLTVYHYPIYHQLYQDTICGGNGYTESGFNIPLQNTAGIYVFTNHHTTIHGCDSVDVLQLWVNSAPAVTAVADPTEICLGDSTTVVAVGNMDNSVPLPPTPHPVAPGDILCTDGSIVKPSLWPCGKTALGVVFWVDGTDEHGWAVHLQEQAPGIAWGASANLSNTNYATARAVIYDTNGYANTLAMRNNSMNYIAGAVDFDNGWFIPAMGQLRLLYAEEPVVNATLQMLGGTALFSFVTYLYTYLWSSSEEDANFAWYMNYGGGIADHHKNYLSTEFLERTRVRSIRNF